MAAKHRSHKPGTQRLVGDQEFKVIFGHILKGYTGPYLKTKQNNNKNRQQDDSLGKVVAAKT